MKILSGFLCFTINFIVVIATAYLLFVAALNCVNYCSLRANCSGYAFYLISVFGCVYIYVCVCGCILCCAGFEFYKYFNNLYRKMVLCVPGTGLAWPWHCLWYTWFFYSLPFAFPFPFSFPYSALDICMSFRTRSQLNCSDNPGDKSINICLT